MLYWTQIGGLVNKKVEKCLILCGLFVMDTGDLIDKMVEKCHILYGLFVLAL